MADRDELLARLAPLRRRCYTPVVEAGDGVATDSKLGGTPYLPPGEDWPRCGCCQQPMPLFLQLNPAQLPEPLRKQYGGDLIQLFYCTSECEVDAEGWAPFSKASLARAVAVAGDPAAPSERPENELEAKVIRSWSHHDDYPMPMECDERGFAIGDDEHDLANELTRSGDKLSGWPYWVQGIEYPSCPKCGKTMRLVFQIDSDDNLDYMFGDTGCAHLTQCPAHPDVLAFGWACC